MSSSANSTKLPYYAVIFTSVRTDINDDYQETDDQLISLVKKQPGFLGLESARSGKTGITVSYWDSLEAIKQWKQDQIHQAAQAKGKEKWYQAYKIRICKVERDYGFQME